MGKPDFSYLVLTVGGGKVQYGLFLNAVISFVLENPAISSLDIGMALDRRGICVRTGHHCCQPVMDRYGVGSTARASFAFYNTHAEVDALADALHDIVRERQAAAPAAPMQTNAAISYPAASAKSSPLDAKIISRPTFTSSPTSLFMALTEISRRLPPCVPTPGTR